MAEDNFDDDAELVAELDEALASEDAPEDCMQLSELDGFLTGLAVAPQAVDPEEWLSWVWGEGFADKKLEAHVAEMVMDHYARIVEDLDEGYGVDPLLWENPDGSADAADWADGFMAAVDIRPEEWLPILDDETARLHLVPILALACDAEGNPLLQLSEAEFKRVADDVETLIPKAVEEIHAYWRARQPD